MYLIAGLGNPENEYANTRHNMGFDSINKLAEHNNIEIKKSRFNALYEIGKNTRSKSCIIKTTNIYE